MNAVTVWCAVVALAPSLAAPPPARKGQPPPNPSFLGILYENDSDGSGVTITDVVPNGPADRAGMRANDVVVKVDGRRIRVEEDLYKAFGTHKPGDTVAIEYQRGAKHRVTKATLIPKPRKQ